MPLSAIILVEDEPLLRESLELILTGAGYTVHTAEDGKKAHELLQTLDQPCLFLVDLLMPNMDGWAFLDHVRDHGEQRGFQHRTLVVSGSANAEDIARQQDAGFLAKPFEVPELLDLVQRYFDSAK